MIPQLIQIFIYLAIVGLILWGISKITGIPEIIKVVIYVVVGVVLLVWIGQSSSLCTHSTPHSMSGSAS